MRPPPWLRCPDPSGVPRLLRVGERLRRDLNRRGVVLARVALLVCVVAGWGFLSGCGLAGGAERRYAVRSHEHGLLLDPDLSGRFYSHQDANTADLYLTDIPIERLRSGVSAGDLAGHVIHVHMFVQPRAGRTPIEPTAFNATITHAVAASGEVGIYRGGGFMAPEGRPGDRLFGGGISAGTLRLERATPGFADRLGVSEVQARFKAVHDERLAALLRLRLNQLVTLANEEASPDAS